MGDHVDFGNAAFGAAGGVLGGAVTALNRETTLRQALVAVLGGLGFGAFLPPAIVAYYDLSPIISGAAGFIAGLAVFGLIAAFQGLGDRVARNPGVLLPKPIADRLPPDAPP